MPGAIYQALDASLTGPESARTLDLYAAATGQAALAPLVGVLALFGITDSYVVQSAVLAQPGAVVLGGRSTFGVPGTDPADESPVDVRLVVDAPDGPDPRFELTLSFTDPGWTFSTTFPTLPRTPHEQAGSVSYVPSFLTGLRLGGPRLVGSSVPVPAVPLSGLLAHDGAPAPQEPAPALTLAGLLWPDGALEPYADTFGPWPLTLSGTVVLPPSPDQSPQMSLVAVSPSLAMQVGGVSVRDVGLGVQVLTGLDPDEEVLTEVSNLLMVGTLTLGSVDPVVARLSAVLLSATSEWRLMVDFEPGRLTLSYGVAQIASFLGVQPGQLMAPDGFGDLGGFYIAGLEFAVSAPTGGVFPMPSYAAVTLGSDREWHPPIPFVLVREVSMRWVVQWTEAGNLLSATLWGGVSGTLVVGEGAPPPGQQAPLLGPPTLPEPPEEDDGGGDDDVPATSFRVDTGAELPSFRVRGSLRDGDEIPIGYAFRTFFGDPGPPTPEDMAVTSFAFAADPFALTFDASATITTDWSVPLGGGLALDLTELSFEIGVTQATVTGAIAGTVELEGVTAEGDPPATFVLRAEYTGSDSGQGWIFTGQMYPSAYLDLVAAAVSFLGLDDAPAGLPSLSVQDVYLSFTTGTGAYVVQGTVVGRWTPYVFGQQLALSAAATVDLASADGGAPAGRLTGTFSVNRLALTVGIDVGVDNPTYLFRIQFGELWLQAVTGLRGAGQAQHQILSVQLGGTTVGAILEYLVNLAAPTLGYTLDSPWSVLNRIELSRFLLTVDPAESTVELTYRVGLDLVFMYVDTVGVRYRQAEGDGAVEMILTGRMLDRTYDSARPLSWDVIRDPPPAVPGQGGALIDLRYLGLGQRVTLRGIDQMWTVAEVLGALQRDMQPPADTRANPLAQPGGSAMVFAPESQWLVGLDVGLLENAISVGLIFNDPRLYGLSVGLSGERMGSLAGLKFEILYKRISDDVGVFRVELRLPDAFRHLELGEVSVTLGVVVVEVYTNGNFMVDLGFPYDRDFGRSFSVEVFPYIGRGGIYVGVLNGTTSTRVPAITNGTFAPVLELGVGLAIGVGKDVTVGSLSGGIFVQVEVVFQGVLAWFNPGSSGQAPALYYWAQGSAAIHGKLYGQVDFKVVKVSVSVEAYAQASVTLEAYRRTVFALTVAADARATVRIAFVDVDFSYHVQLDASFSIGSDHATPWLLAGGSAPSSPQRARSSDAALARQPERRTRALADTHVRAARSLSAQTGGVTSRGVSDEGLLTWAPLGSVFAGGARPVAVTLLPAFGMDQVPLAWGGAAPANPNPAYRVAFLLFAETGAGRAAETLVEGFLRWAVRAVTGVAGGDGATVTAGQLALLAAEMERPATADGAFSAANLAAFFGASMPLRVAGDPGGTPSPQRGMAFPMPPALAWTSPQAGAYDFAADGLVGPLYEWGAARYAATLFPLPTPPSAEPADDPATYESFASFVFRDWCLMVAKSAVQSARDAMQAWTYSVTRAISLGDLADEFPVVTVDYAVRAGDTVASVADALGATAEELEFLNGGDEFGTTLANADAGSTIPVRLGVSPAALATDNATVPLAGDVHLDLGELEYLAAQDDTLAGIAARFGLPAVSALFSGGPLADEPLLLRPGAAFQTTASTWQPPQGWSATLAAAVLYAHWFGGLAVPEANWYAQTVFTLNQAALADVSFDAPIPAGRALSVPAAYGDTSAGPTQYTTVPGDTLTRIGAALALAQVWGDSADGPEPGWPPFRDGVTMQGGVASVPASTVAIFAGETVDALADRTLVHGGDVSGLLAWIGDAPVLRPLAPVRVPTVHVTTRAGDVLADLARDYGLTVADLAYRIRHVDGLWPVDAESPVQLSVTHLPVQYVDTLVDAVLAGAATQQIAGSVSRWMMSGLRLPAPVGRLQDGGDVYHQAAIGALTPLYELTGQQFAGPAPDGDAPDDVALSVTVTLSPTAREPGQWIQLVSSTVVQSGEQAADVAARAPRMADLNPRDAVESPAAGSVVLADTVDALAFAYTSAQLANEYPAASLSLSPTDGPAPLPLAGITPRTYGLDHRISLQSPVPLPVPTVGDAPLAGSPSLWPFPSDFRARARAAAGTPYELVAAVRADGGQAGDTVLDATWATLLPFGVRRLDGADRLYALRGADTATRAVLLDAWQYLQTEASDGTQAFLLVPPSPDARNLTGLNVLGVDAASTYLVQSNLSTETAPGVRSTRDVQLDVQEEQPAAPTSGPYFASFADLEPFARLLWEGSVVGGTGYHLGLRTADGAGIPQTAFDADGNATLYLLLVAGEQQGVASAGRPLLSTNNCALVGPGLDASAQSLYAEAADGSEPVARAVVPPGSVGFTLTLPQPAGDEPADGDTRLRRLFSMVSFKVQAAEGSPFTATDPGLPVPPQAQDGDRREPSEKRRLARQQRTARAVRKRQARATRSTDAALELDSVPDPLPSGDARWLYEQVVPIYRQGPASAAPAVSGLPDPADDPYRGIGAGPLVSAAIRLGMADVVGNFTQDGDDALVTAPVGYTDPLLGVSGWPAVTPSYAVASAGGQLRLDVVVAPQPGAVAPSPMESAAASAARAARQAETYGRAYYQLAQPDVTAALLTTLKQDGGGQPTPLPVDVAPLRRFAASGWLAAQAAASVTPVRPAADAAATLSAIAAGWGVSWAALAAANADQPASLALRGAPLVVPAYLVFAAGDTAVSLAAPRPGWPSNSGAGLLALPQNADELPLRPGAVLVVPAMQYVLDGTDPSPALADLAADANTTPALLAADNAAAADVLASGFVFEMGGIAVTAGVTQVQSGAVAGTFDLVRQAFEEVGIHSTVGDIAAANGDRPGMLAPGASLATRHYVAVDGDTLSANATGFTAQELAAANASTPDLYDAGALVYAGTFDPTVTQPLDNAETLRQLADRFACPLEQILAASAAVQLPAGATLLVPGAATVPPTAWVPCTVQLGDTMQTVAARFAWPGDPSPADNLAAANEWMPGTVAADVRVTVTAGGKTATVGTEAGDSFGSVLARLQSQVPSLTLADLVASVGGTVGFLLPGALLSCPPAVLAAGVQTLSQVATAYGVGVTAFAQANAGTAGLLAPRVSLSTADGAVTVTTGDHDTFNSVLSRFAQAGAQVGMAEVADANVEVPLFPSGALALLPTTPVTLQAGLGTAPGPFATPVFPLRAGIRIQRPQAVVSPEFATDGTGPVERADTPVPAPQATTGDGDSATLTFDAFVQSFQSVMPTLRLATGRVEGTDGDLWVVDFGANGIDRVSVSPGVAVDGETWPRFFALRPLYADLVSRQAVPFPTLNADGTLADETTPTDFQGVDVEVWARRFLADVDLFLTAPYAGAAYLNAGSRLALQQLIAAKRVLGEAVPGGLAAVLQVDDAKEAAGLAEAARLLGQEMDVSLSSAYDVAAVLQYDAAVGSAWNAAGTTLKPARLSGTPVSAGAGDGEAADQRPFTLTGAKIPLNQQSPFVTFLMRVSDPAHHGRVAVDLTFSVLDLEFGITPVPGVTGYEASSWLAFVPPLAGDSVPAAIQATLGSATVPVPLRAYPSLPALLAQGADASSDTPGTLAQAAAWTYSLTYSHEHAEQDEVLVTARFNITPPHARLARAVTTDVASALACYVVVADALWALLDGFADDTRAVDADVLANAAGSFAALAADVATAWAGHWPGGSAPRSLAVPGAGDASASASGEADGVVSDNDGASGDVLDGAVELPVQIPVGAAPVLETYGYSVRLTDRQGDDGAMVLDTLELVAVSGSAGPGGFFPEISARAPDGSTVSLVPYEGEGSVRRYQFPEGVPIPASDWPVITIAWPNLPVAGYQNAEGTVSVRRNQRLLGADGPATAAGFVYQTPAVTATDLVVPLNAWTEAVDITALGSDVQSALQAAFDQVFESTVGHRITVGMLFGYELVPGTSLVTYLPVGLYPNQTLGPGTAAAIAGALAAWQQANQPAATSAEWAFSLTAYSQLGADARRPVLTFDRLVYRFGQS